MRRILLTLLLVLGCCGIASAQRSVVVTGTVRDANGSLYINGTGRASIVPPTGVQQPVVTIVSLGANATFSIQVADTSQVQPVNTAQWQFSFCSQGYVNNNGQTSQYCFTMTPMPIAGPGPIDISAQIQAQAAILPTVIGGAFTAGGDLSGTNVSQTVTGLQGHSVSASSPSAGQFLRYNGTSWLTTLLTGGDIPNNAANTSGNAATATALAAAPTGCTGVNFSQGINASGTANCAQPSNVTGNSATATALFGTPTLCSTNNAPLGISPNGNANGCFSVNMFSGLIPGTNANGALHIGSGGSLDATGSGTITATTALAASGTPTLCSAGQAAQGINSNFSAAGCFSPGGGPPGGSTFDVQINNAGNLASGVTNQANVGTVGNIARKVISTDNIRYVSANGNDSNDGLSWGTAKLTVMAAYDALPAVGGTVYICGGPAPTGPYVNATSTGQGIWIMGPSDPNYASPPTGWRQGKPISFIGSCGTTGDQQGNKPTVFVGANGGLGPWIWLSSMTSSNINPHFENLSSRYYSTAVQIGVDSNGAQTNTSGVFGASFDNIQTKMCNPTCTSGQGPGWLIGGGDDGDLYFNNLVIAGNGQATPGSDNQAAMLFKPASGINSVIATVTNSILEAGEIKYYEPQGGSTIAVKNVYSENLNGTGVTPGVGVFWAASSTGSNTFYHIEDVFAADSTGSVCYARFDPFAWHEGQITTVNTGGICSGGTANPTQQGSIVANNLGPLQSAPDPLTQNATGVSYGRYYGFLGNTQRQLAPSAVRYQNIANSSSSSWTISGAGGSISTGITAPDGTTGAARVTATTNNVNITFASPSLTLAVGQYLVAGLYQRFNSPDDYYDFNGAATYGLSINIGGSGNTANCSFLWPPAIATDEWFWTWELCKVTAAPSTPATITVSSAAPVVGSHTSVMDFYAPMLLNIPAGASNDDVYELANSLVPYNSSCVAGTVCGMGGTWQATSLVVSSIAAGTSPICPNGTGGALTTAGCSGGGGGSSNITVNGGSPVASPNFQNGAASLGDTINMVQSGSNISTQLAAGSVRTVPGGGTGASTLTAHGPLIGEGTSPIAAAGPGLVGQCFLSGGAGADPSFSNCPTGFVNPMSTVGDTIYGGGGGSASRLAGPTTPNGVSETLVEIPSSGAANPPQWSLTGVPVDAQTGSGYTVGATDRASLITLSNAGPQNLTLVDPSTAGFTSSFPFVSKNIGAAAWTDVCTTFLCNGSASLLLPPNWTEFAWSNNSTYTVSRFPDFSVFANTGTNAAETFTSATGAFGSLTIGPASSTNGDVASFNGTGGLPLADSGVLAANLVTNSVSGTTNAMSKWSATHTLTNSTLQDDATNVKLTTEPLDLVTKSLLEEVANASSTGTTVNKLAKLTGAPSTLIITTAGDTEFEGIVVGGAGTTGSAQIAAAGSAVSCVFDGATTAGDYVQNSASVNGDCADAGATRPTSGGKIVGKVLSTNGGAGTYAVLAYGPDHPAISTSGGSAPTLKTNGSNNTDQTALNLQNSSATNGLTLTVTNTGTSNVQLGVTGTLNNSGLTNSATTVNGQTCTLGSTCTVAPLVSLDTTTPVTVSTTAIAGYYNNQNATAGTAVTYNLPTAAAQKQFCFTNSNNGTAADTGVLTIATSAAGQFIIFTDGTLSATGGNIASGGAAGDAACVVGIDSTHWQAYVQRGTWTKN